VPVNGENQDGCNEFKMTDFIREPAAVDSIGAENRSEAGGLLGGVSEREVERELLKERAAIMVKRGGCSFVKKSLNI
jgi:hypothetical protein